MRLVRTVLVTGCVLVVAGGAVAGDVVSRRSPAPAARPASTALAAPASCAAGAGQLAFSASALRVDEGDGQRAMLVLRTGGSAGAVSARVTATDGSASAGTDYVPPTEDVGFDDGDATVTLVTVPVVDDAIHEDDETLTVSLTDPVCATVGSPATVVLTIVDDDPVPTFTVGGTVTGLEGDGLVLRNESLDTPIAADGPFVLAGPLPAGSRYSVTVRTQPSDPDQLCTVAGGEGVMPAADVADVAVSCRTPAPVSALDPSFGTDGKVTTPGRPGVQALAVQPDGKVLAAGDSTLTRYEPDGSVDTGFGAGGTVATGLDAGFLGDAADVAVQYDGLIVVVGVVDNPSSTGEDFGLKRYDSNGVPDPGFGIGGAVTTDFAGGVDRAYAVAVQADGAIVVAGHAAEPSGVSDFAVARYTPAGAPDTTFAGTGRVTTAVPGAAGSGFALALQADGGLVVAGRVTDERSGDDRFGVVRYGTDGTPDPTFGAGGLVTVPIGFGAIARGVVVDGQGRILVVGHGVGAFSGTRSDFALVRLDPTGVPDPFFGTGGTVTTDFPGVPGSAAHDEFAKDVALQSDGRIVAVGVAQLDVGADLAMARYLPDGTPDASFGAGGRITVDFHGKFDAGNDVAVQPADGRIVVGGSAVNGFAVEAALVRFLP